MKMQEIANMVKNGIDMPTIIEEMNQAITENNFNGKADKDALVAATIIFSIGFDMLQEEEKRLVADLDEQDILNLQNVMQNFG